MGILAEDIARVRAATDFVQVASEHIALKKVGQRWMGLCPFHAEKTPSFSVNAQEGLWYCHGCQMKGDVITFVREIEHLEFAEAVERLAARAGIQLRYDQAAVSHERQRRTKLIEAMERAVEWYHQRLLTAADAAPARSYLRSRGYEGDVVRAFRIGWAPDDWDALAQALSLPVDVLRDTGLGFVNRRDRPQDAFRARIMFPIFDARGEPVAFGGRQLPGGQGPKYKNSAETAIYSKSRVLYGLNWSKADVVRAGEVIVCEGYTDVIGFAQAGLPRAVATCGTALAEEHFRLLKNFARRVVLGYDADAAGQAAAERFYEWERRYELDIAVADLPTGADPADVARTDPERLRKAVEEARPFLAFRLDRALGSTPLSSPEARARAAEAALAVIREHPDEFVRDQYLMRVEERTTIDAARLREAMKRGRLAPAPGRPATPASASRVALPRGPEEQALLLAVHRPEDMVGRLHDVLFADELHLAAYRALASSATLHEAIEAADPGAATLLQRLAVEEPDAEPVDVVARLADEAASRIRAELHSHPGGDEGATERVAMDAWLYETILALRETDRAAEASDRLVRWLVDRSEEEA